MMSATEKSAAMLPPAISRHPIRELLTLAIPLTTNSLSAALMLFVDALMVSRLGTKAIAAVLPVHLVFWLIWAIPNGIAGAGGIFSAQAIGKQNHTEAVRYTWQGIWVALASIFGAILAQLNAGPLLIVLTPDVAGTPAGVGLFDFTHADGEVNALMHAYFNWRNWALPFVAVLWPIGAYFAALRRPWLPVYVAVGAQIINIVLNYVLIFGKLGFPAMGVSGSAAAGLIATAIQALVLLGFFVAISRTVERNHAASWAGPDRKELPSIKAAPLARLARPDLFRLRRLIDIGVPSGCHVLLDLVGWNLIMIVFVKRFGTEALAATNIVTEYMRLSFMPMFGVAGAAATIIGTVIGAGRSDLAISRARLALLIVGGYMSLCGLLMILLRQPLVALFNEQENPVVASAGAWMMVLAGLFQVFDAANVVYSSACRGAGDTRFLVRLVAMASLCSVVGGWYLTDYQPQLGSFGPWLAGSIYVIMLGLGFAWRFESRRWEGIDIFTSGPLSVVSDQPNQTVGEDDFPLEGKNC